MPEILKPILRPIYVPIANWIYEHYTGPQRYHHLYDTITQGKVVRIMEVGVWTGDKAKRMIETAQKASPEATIEYYGFDLFEDLGEEGFHDELSKRPPTQAAVQQLLEATGATIHLYAGNTLETLPKAVPTLTAMDFIYIDGGHKVSTIQSDWDQVKGLMHDKTVVIFDDYWHNRTDVAAKAVVDGIDANEYDVTVLPEVDVFTCENFGRKEISFARVIKKSTTI